VKTPAMITKVLTDYFRWLAGGVALIVLMVGYVLVVAPKMSQVQSSEVSQRKTFEADLKAKQEYIVALKQSNQKFDVALPVDQRQVIDDFLPSETDFPGLILTVKNIVAQSKLSLDSISVGQGGSVAVTAGAATTPSTTAKTPTTPSAQAATAGGVNVKTQDISITVSGGSSYDALKALLTNIESSRRLFDVVSLSFAAAAPKTSGATTGSTSTAWSLVLRSYYLPSI